MRVIIIVIHALSLAAYSSATATQMADLPSQHNSTGDDTEEWSGLQKTQQLLFEIKLSKLKNDVLDTLDTLKEVLVQIEQKWDDEPAAAEGRAAVSSEQSKSPGPPPRTRPGVPDPPRNGFQKPPHMEIIQIPEKRHRDGKVYDCPHPWPYHDAYPVYEAVCTSDNDCGDTELCCQLFHNNHCLKPLDATPRPGECRFTEFNYLARLHCMVDDPGCQYDSECAEPTWKCCQGGCPYKECLPSTVSLSPSDLQKQLRASTSTTSPSRVDTDVAGHQTAPPRPEAASTTMTVAPHERDSRRHPLNGPMTTTQFIVSSLVQGHEAVRPTVTTPTAEDLRFPSALPVTRLPIRSSARQPTRPAPVPQTEPPSRPAAREPSRPQTEPPRRSSLIPHIGATSRPATDPRLHPHDHPTTTRPFVSRQTERNQPWLTTEPSHRTLPSTTTRTSHRSRQANRQPRPSQQSRSTSLAEANYVAPEISQSDQQSWDNTLFSSLQPLFENTDKSHQQHPTGSPFDTPASNGIPDLFPDFGGLSRQPNQPSNFVGFPQQPALQQPQSDMFGHTNSHQQINRNRIGAQGIPIGNLNAASDHGNSRDQTSHTDQNKDEFSSFFNFRWGF